MGFPTVKDEGRERCYLFQSLVGIYGFSDKRPTKQSEPRNFTFQSLVGIYGFSDQQSAKATVLAVVSIPGRDLWVFRRQA